MWPSVGGGIALLFSPPFSILFTVIFVTLLCCQPLPCGRLLGCLPHLLLLFLCCFWARSSAVSDAWVFPSPLARCLSPRFPFAPYRVALSWRPSWLLLFPCQCRASHPAVFGAWQVVSVDASLPSLFSLLARPQRALVGLILSASQTYAPFSLTLLAPAWSPLIALCCLQTRFGAGCWLGLFFPGCFAIREGFSLCCRRYWLYLLTLPGFGCAGLYVLQLAPASVVLISLLLPYGHRAHRVLSALYASPCARRTLLTSALSGSSAATAADGLLFLHGLRFWPLLLPLCLSACCACLDPCLSSSVDRPVCTPICTIALHSSFFPLHRCGSRSCPSFFGRYWRCWTLAAAARTSCIWPYSWQASVRQPAGLGSSFGPVLLVCRLLHLRSCKFVFCAPLLSRCVSVSHFYHVTNLCCFGCLWFPRVDAMLFCLLGRPQQLHGAGLRALAAAARFHLLADFTNYPTYFASFRLNTYACSFALTLSSPSAPSRTSGVHGCRSRLLLLDAFSCAPGLLAAPTTGAPSLRLLPFFALRGLSCHNIWVCRLTH